MQAARRFGIYHFPALMLAVFSYSVACHAESSDAQMPREVGKQIKALKDQEVNARRQAVVALGQMGPAAKDAVPALIEALKDEDVCVRGNAVGALGNMGPAAKDAVLALNEALQNWDADMRDLVARALGRIETAATPPEEPGLETTSITPPDEPGMEAASLIPPEEPGVAQAAGRKKQMQQWFAKGQELFRASDFDGAIEAWQQVLLLDPNHAPSIINIERAKELIEENK